MLKGGEHKSARSEIKQDFPKRLKKNKAHIHAFLKGAISSLGFQTIADCYFKIIFTSSQRRIFFWNITIIK
ncbi:MAG: hypothetical protein COW89_05710 [Nitrospinae bacterium CG22_combo_CG10-13_8_21_14_all_47_10]|nr:MAG: hypothetical protein COW89_05710 [Nitrospinae bacterium CG22_combo_CG10-13_8_21_14_all_47_10]